MSPPPLLVVAGEASGDDFAASVLSQLDVDRWGHGGPHSQAQGLELCRASADLGFGHMGLLPVLRRLPGYARLYAEIAARVGETKPSAALLVGFSDFNLRLGQHLKAHGVRVLWLAPPQVWAWRRGRASAVLRAADQLAVVLPFEESFWRSHGAACSYVGHPSLSPLPHRESLRRELCVPSAATPLLLLLPGSRDQECSKHLPTLLAVAERVRRQHGMTPMVVGAPGLRPETRRHLAKSCQRRAVRVLPGPAARWLPAFDLALVASGTASLECAVARVPPVIVHQLPRTAVWLGRRLVDVPWIGLPNLVLGCGAFPEHVGQLVVSEISADLARLHATLDAARLECDRVRSTLTRPLPPDGGPSSPGERVADLLEPWLKTPPAKAKSKRASLLR